MNESLAFLPQGAQRENARGGILAKNAKFGIPDVKLGVVDAKFDVPDAKLGVFWFYLLIPVTT